MYISPKLIICLTGLSIILRAVIIVHFATMVMLCEWTWPCPHVDDHHHSRHAGNLIFFKHTVTTLAEDCHIHVQKIVNILITKPVLILCMSTVPEHKPCAHCSMHSQGFIWGGGQGEAFPPPPPPPPPPKKKENVKEREKEKEGERERDGREVGVAYIWVL